MGRKPKAAKLAEATANMVEKLNPSTEIFAPQTELLAKSNTLGSKNKVSAGVRRSGRILNLASALQNQETEAMVEEINLCESEKEDVPYVGGNPSEPMLSEMSIEEKLIYLSQAIEELKSKAARCDEHSADLKYKSLYIDSQKKVEALTKENFELSRKLDVALGKIEAYGEASHVCSEVLGKLKDVLLISNLAKTTESAMNLSSEAIMQRFSSVTDAGEPRAAEPRVPKRKYRAKGDNNN